MTTPQEPTRDPASEGTLDCARFLAAIDDRLAEAGAVSDSRLDSFAAHRERCRDCALAWESARRFEAFARRWIAPDPPVGFKDRVFSAWIEDRDRERRGCDRFTARLEAWRAGDLDSVAAAECARHLEHCASCTDEAHLAKQVESAARAWVAPLPGPTFAARILLESHAFLLGSPEAMRRTDSTNERRVPAARSNSLRRLRAAAFSAALLAAALLLVTVPNASRPSNPERHAETPAPATPRADVRGAVSAEARPASIGSFAGAPRRIERIARSGGNLFHRSLREAKLDGIAADPVPTRIGGASR